jgi:hypothetical protein
VCVCVCVCVCVLCVCVCVCVAGASAAADACAAGGGVFRQERERQPARGTAWAPVVAVCGALFLLAVAAASAPRAGGPRASARRRSVPARACRLPCHPCHRLFLQPAAATTTVDGCGDEQVRLPRQGARWQRRGQTRTRLPGTTGTKEPVSGRRYQLTAHLAAVRRTLIAAAVSARNRGSAGSAAFQISRV